MKLHRRETGKPKGFRNFSRYINGIKLTIKSSRTVETINNTWKEETRIEQDLMPRSEAERAVSGTGL